MTMRFRVKLEELNLTLNIKSEEITPPLSPSRKLGVSDKQLEVIDESGRAG